MIEAVERYMATGGDRRRSGPARRSQARHELDQLHRQIGTLLNLASWEREDRAGTAGLAALYGRVMAERRRLLALLSEAVRHG